MFKKFLLLFVILFSIHATAQKLVYKSNGNITDTENNKIAPDKVRILLANNEKLLVAYNAGRSKKTVGNVLIVGGIGLFASDLLVAVFSPTDYDENYGAKKIYPSALTYIGLAAVAIAIPVKIGFSKKIKNVVNEYNKNNYTSGFIHKTEFITNNKGLGFRLTLN